MTGAVWHIGQWLNLIQSTFVGLLRVWSVPIVLLLSVASGYTTYYGLSFFITPWIALIITVAVQSIIVICSLELAGMHWRANPVRFATVVISLMVAVTVSVSFSYFKFYEFSERDSLLIGKLNSLSHDLEDHLGGVVGLKGRLMADQQKRVKSAADQATQAYLGALPEMQGPYRHQIGRGRVWSHYNEILQAEQAKQKELETRFQTLDKHLSAVRLELGAFASRLEDASAYQRLTESFQNVRTTADNLASGYGIASVPAPRLGPYAEFARGVTPSFAMWENVSWFALACAAMVDFFTLILSYRLEFSAPGPLTEEEKDLAYAGIRQFRDFTINKNDELEFVFEKTELERARRYSDWTRMFAVAFLLNRGYLRKMSDRSVEFAPNLYPIIAERLSSQDAADPLAEPHATSNLADMMKRKGYG